MDMQDSVISCFTPEKSTDRIMEVYICKLAFGLPLLRLPNLENNATLHILSNVLFLCLSQMPLGTNNVQGYFPHQELQWSPEHVHAKAHTLAVSALN